MRDDEQVTDTSETTQSLFAQMLQVWVDYRRIILSVLIFIALVALFTSLEPATRTSLVRGLFANRTLFILLLAFSLLMLSLLWSAGQRMDVWIFTLFNLRGHHPLWLDRLMWLTTQIGNGFLGILLSIVLYFINLRRLAVEMLLGILSLWLGVEILKAITERSRPFIAIEGTHLVGWRERGLSFPSGHTSQTFFMITLLAQYFQVSPLVGLAMYGLALLVGFTRIYVGAHYPRDVMAGAVLGSVWGILLGLIEAYLTSGRF